MTHGSERWVWLEPIGFDNTQPDCGVAEYLDKTGFVPDAICLLMTSPDIVLQHPGMEREVALATDICSREGHSHTLERARQDWTNHQVRALVGALQAAGVKVLLSFFTQYFHNTHHREWVSDHPELLTRYNHTENTGSYNPLKRFRNGEFFEDVFVDRLAATLRDYGFDGWHGPDGNGPLFGGHLYNADYSDDMLRQFADARAVTLPKAVWDAGETTMQGRRARAEHVWRHLRADWIAFWCDRWAAFWRKAMDRLHAEGKIGVINNAWARAPWESLYRYGIDYRKIMDAGVDAMIVETVAPGLCLDPRPGTRAPNRSYDMYSMLQLIRAYVPDSKLIFLLNTQDVVEQWDAIRHVPTVLEREIFNVNNVYLQTGRGRLRRGADGSLACLGDGIRRNEWRTLTRWWDLSVETMPRRVLGATLLWSDSALHAQGEEFTRHRTWDAHRILAHLMEHGAPVQSSVRIEHLDHAEGPLLVIHPHLLPAEERARVAAYARGPVVAIGPDLSGLPNADGCFSDAHAPRPMQCGWWRVASRPAPEITADSALPPLPEDLLGIFDKVGYWDPLEARPVSTSFLKACADVITASLGGVSASDDTSAVTAMFMELEDGRIRVALKNKMPWYAKACVDLGRPIRSAAVKTDFPLVAIEPKGSQFSVRVTAMGLVVVDVEFA